MKLKRLSIDLNESYEDNPGKYTVSATYEHNQTETKLVMDASVSEKVMAFIGPVIVAGASATARQLEADLKQSITEANKSEVLEIAGA